MQICRYAPIILYIIHCIWQIFNAHSLATIAITPDEKKARCWRLFSDLETAKADGKCAPKWLSLIGKEPLKGFSKFSLSFEVGKTKQSKNNARVWQKCCVKIIKYGNQKFKLYTGYYNILQAFFFFFFCSGTYITLYVFMKYHI